MTIDAEAVRNAAMSALGPAADPRARDVLLHSRLTVDPDVASWSGSTGRMHGHRVRLELDAHDLGALHGAPAVHDDVTAALARAISVVANGALAGLDAFWGFSRSAQGYRSSFVTEADHSDPRAVQEALRDYLGAVGETALAGALQSASIEIGEHARIDRRTVTIRSDESLLRHVHVRGALERAVLALLARHDRPKGDVRVQVLAR